MGFHARRAAVRPVDRRERGAVLLETAIVIGVLLTLVFGTVEFGYHWRITHETVGASRAGARVGAGLGNDRTSDYYMLTTIRASLLSAGMDGQVDRVVVFRANSAGQPASSCLQASPSGTCNVYPGSILPTLALSDFNTAGCTNRASHSGWCPTSRSTNQLTADYLGVYVIMDSSSITGLFPDRDIRRRSIMRIEPTRTGP